jgi:hypothetical protein
MPPVRPLRSRIEINTREHFALLGYQRRQLEIANPWFSSSAGITTFGFDELLAEQGFST